MPVTTTLSVAARIPQVARLVNIVDARIRDHANRAVAHEKSTMWAGGE